MNISDLLRAVFSLIGIFAIAGISWATLDERRNKNKNLPLWNLICTGCGYVMILSVIGLIICGFLWVWGVS